MAITTQQREMSRGQALANSTDDTVEQLDCVLNSMFKLLSEDVEPFIEDQKARVALKSYTRLSKNLMKSLKMQSKQSKKSQ